MKIGIDMNIFVLSALAVGLSMDAFAVSVSKGLTATKDIVKKAVIVGLYFGIFQAAMPLIGYALSTGFSSLITTFSHWIAFGLLCFLGIKMIISSRKKDDMIYIETQKTTLPETVAPPETVVDHAFGPKQMLPLALATSIDALAVGVSIALLQANIVPVAIASGTATFTLSAVGVKIGSIFGMRFKSKAELIGGIILILIGLNILRENISFI